MKTIQKKEAYLHTLDIRGNIYEQFVPDQVLTHNNLNKIVNYFEDQDRLSRIHLSGVGIGCGLNITSFRDNKIEIGQGVGVTTDGDLIKTETSEFLSYTKFSDKGAYPLFEELEVFEIHAQEGAGHRIGGLPLSSFNNLNNYMVIAYVENYTEDAGLCDGFDCDDSGIKVFSNLKFLITHKDNFHTLTNHDTIYNSHNVLDYYDGLPELQIPRLLLNKTNTKSIRTVYDKYVTAITANNLIPDLLATIKTIITKLNHRINFAKFGIFTSELDILFEKTFKNINLDLAIQYKYDLVKDLLETYEQIRNLLLKIHFECVPTVNAFPKHLLIGTLAEKTRLQTRHLFYPSPIVSGNDENLMEVRSLIIKFYNQIKQYKIPATNSAAIKITPSKDYSHNLSQRTIPYYYQTKNTLVNHWNFKDLQNRKPTNQLGYHTNNLNSTQSIQKPLEFTHLGKDFYRIEGHLGKNYKVALNKINRLKSENNLAFDVKTISIGFPISRVNFNDVKCDNKNYLTLLKTWEKDFSCKADSAVIFFSKYSIAKDSIGENYSPKRVFSQKQFRTVRDAQNDVAVAKKTRSKVLPTDNKKVRINAVETNTNYKKSIKYVMDEAKERIQGSQYSSLMLSGMVMQMLDELLVQADIHADDRFLYIENPVRIISDLQVLQRDFIKDLNSFYQTDKWIAFHTALDQLCLDLKRAILTLSNVSEDATFGGRVFDKMYDYFIYELSDFCCLKEKMNWLKEQLDEVRLDMYKDLILSELIQEHPGIEHMAGVPKGGTFLMVYVGGIKQDRGANIRRNIRTKKVKSNSFDGNIFFDFALPYSCYSSCPPQTIVYQIDNTVPEPVGLEIARQRFCFSDEDVVTNTLFRVSPLGKELTSPNGSVFIEGNLDNYSFNPNVVPNALLGEPITFVVGNQVIPASEVEIKAYKLPTVREISVQTNITWKEEGLEVEFNFEHTLKDSHNYFKYAWQSEGEILHPISANNPNIFLFPEVDGQVVKEVFLVITVDDVDITCNKKSKVIKINETRPVTQYTVDIDKKSYCLPNDVDKQLFTITPAGGILTSPNANAVNNFILEDQGNYAFAPSNVGDALLGEPITFLVNGNPPTNNLEIRAYLIPDSIRPGFTVLNTTTESELKLKLFTIDSTSLENKSYLKYTWLLERTGGAPIEIANTRRVDEVTIPFINSEVVGRLILKVEVVGMEVLCNNKFKVAIREKGALALTCASSIEERLGLFNIIETSNAINAEINDAKYKVVVHVPLQNLITNVSAIPQGTAILVNNLRDILNKVESIRIELNNYINNPSFAAFKNQLFKVDEILELIVLEVLRCVSVSKFESVFSTANVFFERSNGINLLRRGLNREMINNNYSDLYIPISSLLRTGYDNTFLIV